MATLTRRYMFEFDELEVAILLKLVMRTSPREIGDLGLDTAAHERLYSTLSEAAYAPMLERAP